MHVSMYRVVSIAILNEEIVLPTTDRAGGLAGRFSTGRLVILVMPSNTDEPEVVRVSQKGQATIPKALREKFGIEAPGEVFVFEEGGRIVLEPVPTLEELQGIHASDREPGEAMAKARKMRAEDRRMEQEKADRLVKPHTGDEEEQ